MPILINPPLVIPEKSYDKYWAKTIVISSPIPDGEASAVISFVPYGAGGSYEKGAINMRISSIMARADLNPEGNIAKAMFYLLEAIREEKAAQDAAAAPV